MNRLEMGTKTVMGLASGVGEEGNDNRRGGMRVKN